MGPPVSRGGAARAEGRRYIPLREVTVPHQCPRPVRMRVLSRVPYFQGLPESDISAIDERMQTSSWTPDSPIYHAGDRADHLYVVAEGRVKLSQVTLSGTESLTDILVPGELFGAMGTLGEPVHLQSASALVGSCTLRIGQESFREILVEHPSVALRVLDDVAARLARAQADIGGQSTDSVAQRVATSLLRLADKLGQDRGARGVLLEVPLSRVDLAGLARSTPESVSRVMSRWRREGVIDSGRRWTAILERDRLESEAEGE
ncbi:MAG: Crp/Fnr family transcriptional regulator [Dermatophilus congolensis]|nr:Crp/Fnr family transcriptional regulator [Dermatophilus congolensis]